MMHLTVSRRSVHMSEEMKLLLMFIGETESLSNIWRTVAIHELCEIL